MTLPTGSRNNYTGNGTTLTYAYSFKIFNTADLLVTVRDSDDAETTLTLTTHYTVTGDGDAGGGNVVLVAGAFAWIDGSSKFESGWTLSIRRVVDVEQNTDIRNQGAFLPEAHEDALDYQTMISQQLKDESDRSIKLPESENPSGFTLTIPAADSRASKVLGFDASGNVTALTNVPTGAVTISSFSETYLDDANAAAVLTTLGVSSYVQTILNDTTAAVARGTLVITNTVSPAAIGANQNDYDGVNVDGAVILGRLTATSTYNITGITAGAAGEVLILVNIGANALTLKHLSGSSSAANQIHTGTTADLVLAALGTLVLVYDGTSSVWRAGGIIMDASQLASNVVTTTKITDANVTAAKLSSTAVDNTNTNKTLITGQTEKATPTTSDYLLISDAAASDALKKATIGNVLAALSVKGYQMLFYGSAHPQGNGTASMLPGDFGTASPNGLRDTLKTRLEMTRAGTLRNLRVRFSSNLTAGTVEVTVRKNGVSGAITALTTNGNATGTDTSNTMTVVAGDLIELTYTQAGGADAFDVKASLQVDFT